ncbi:MAG: hypothetical protein E7C50_00390 [Clostridium sp.]|uniref:hypothetical protein n=1 Tax=Clostridium sp. TaxID=1506 RepID=UPI0029039B3E|nr:hypothetical protein [Clostridium sp.]MDU2674222.1 hypothetical protein [Clostridium sp.]MDU2680317.1 hypothetical protein [Clostridium sp.]
MNKKITKIEVNNEIKEIRKLIENEEINKAEFKSFELSEAIVPDKNNADPYFKNECVNVISKIIMKECNKESKEQIDIDYIINNFEVLSEEVMNVQERVKSTLKVEIIAILELLK